MEENQRHWEDKIAAWLKRACEPWFYTFKL
jgi:hypothetical protein